MEPGNGGGARPPGKTLVLLRHAKSAWPEGVLDHDRPLAGRGRRDAPATGAWLRAAGYVPDLVLCSTARRARQTWQLAEEGLLAAGESGRGKPGAAAPPVSYEREIYAASVAELLGLLHRQPAELRTLLVVGHEPGMSELALMLAGPAGEQPAASRPAGEHLSAAGKQARVASAAPGPGPMGAGAGAPGLARLRVKFPTAAIAVLTAAGAWSALGPGQARLARFVTPREIRDGSGEGGPR